MYALGGVKKEPVKGNAKFKIKYLNWNFVWKESVITQIIGHGDETKASDVGIITRLMELLLGCVIAGEALCCFWEQQHRDKSVSAGFLDSHCISDRVCFIYSPTCGDLKGFSFSCFSNSAREVFVINSWNVKERAIIALITYNLQQITNDIFSWLRALATCTITL